MDTFPLEKEARTLHLVHVATLQDQKHVLIGGAMRLPIVPGNTVLGPLNVWSSDQPPVNARYRSGDSHSHFNILDGSDGRI